MAISAVLRFKTDAGIGDSLASYDAIVDEMGVRDNPAKGAVYHWCAAAPDGLRICDVWESREDFERFAQEQIRPLAAKHGLGVPQIEIGDVHEMVPGRLTGHKGTGLILDVDGDASELLKKIDEANRRMNVVAQPPEGLIFHWTTSTPTGVRAIDHWRSRADFERFVESALGPAMQSLSMPQPRQEFFEIHNTIDKRVAAIA